ncbi:hypothetical protein [Peribacillus butanolivorans]|uniref:hypothetical protein n=1 Tax=Peribacillus butanolivorans TaxID=421767 RepID=UPI0035D63B28
MALLLMGYSMVTQLFPSFIASLLQKNFVTKQGASAGILAGLATVGYTTITSATLGTLFPKLPQAIKDLNIGLVALLINVIVMIGVSLITKNLSTANKDEIEAA